MNAAIKSDYMYVTTQGVKFDIITTTDEIFFIDEGGGSLTWDNNARNEVLVNNMVHELTTRIL